MSQFIDDVWDDYEQALDDRAEARRDFHAARVVGYRRGEREAKVRYWEAVARIESAKPILDRGSLL